MAQAAIPNKNTVIRSYPIADAEEWLTGAIISLTAGEISEEAGTDPTPFLGFAAHDVPLDVDIYDGKGMVYCAYPTSTFWLSPSTGAFVQTDEGKKYGLVLVSGVATVDRTDTTAVRVYVERVDLDRNLAECSILGGHRQLQDEGES